MKKFVIRWILLTLATAITVWLVPGIEIVGDNKWYAFGSFALFMALINASIKPFMHVISLPFSIVTFGLVALAINAVCFELAGWLATNVIGYGIVSGGFLWSLLAAVVLSIVSSILSAISLDADA